MQTNQAKQTPSQMQQQQQPSSQLQQNSSPASQQQQQPSVQQKKKAIDYEKINLYVKEFLKFNKYQSTFECFEAEERTKLVTSKLKVMNLHPEGEKQLEEFPRLYRFYEADSGVSGKEKRLEKELRIIKNKFLDLLNSARQIFAVAVTAVNHLDHLKMGNIQIKDMGEVIENCQIQLGKYHQILIDDVLSQEKGELFSQAFLSEHKNRIIKAKDEKKPDVISEILLSLRVNALQMPVEQRHYIVNELVNNDMFLLTKNKNNELIDEMMALTNHSLKHNLCSILSIIASTHKGAQYLTQNNLEIPKAFILFLKEQEDNSVTQRFCLAFLQKLSVIDTVLPLYLELNMFVWGIRLLEKHKLTQIHPFCLQFATGIMVNMLTSSVVQDTLEKTQPVVKEHIIAILGLLKEKIPSQALLHLLWCLFYLNNERFAIIIGEIQLKDKIQEFHEFYSSLNLQGTDREKDKETVLEQCLKIINYQQQKPVQQPGNQAAQPQLEKDKQEQKLAPKIDNDEDDDLIFECFLDEVN